jgi:HK97 gp10 family phage protein
MASRAQDQLLQIKGLKELYQTLQELPAKTERNILRGAVRASASVVRERARELVPIKSGALKKSIRISTRTKGGNVTAAVRAGSKTAYYAHMIEYGTASFYTGSGKTVGRPYSIGPTDQATGGALKINVQFVSEVLHPGIAPKPFMRPALDQSAPKAIEAFANYVRDRIGTLIP